MPGRSANVLSWQMPVALLTAASVLTAGIPAHAFPDARVNLIRISSEGVTAMPGLEQAQLPVAAPASSPGALISETPPPAGAGDGPTLLSEASKPLVMTFAGPLPEFGLDDYLLIGLKSDDNNVNNTEVEQIRFDSPAVVISPDRRTLTITPTKPIEKGQTLAALLPTGNYVLPLATSSCFFQLAPPPSPGWGPSSCRATGAGGSAAHFPDPARAAWHHGGSPHRGSDRWSVQWERRHQHLYGEVTQGWP